MPNIVILRRIINTLLNLLTRAILANNKLYTGKNKSGKTVEENRTYRHSMKNTENSFYGPKVKVS